MKFQITPEASLAILKYSMALTCCWPPSLNANRSKIFICDILCFLAFISAMLLLIPLLNSVYQDRSDTMILLKSIYLSCAAAHVANKIAICWIHRYRLQEVTDFLHHANERERNIMQHYADKYGILHVFFTISNYMGALGVILGPLFTSAPFPTDAKYPFAVDFKPVKYVIYAHQSLTGFQVSAAMSIDCLVGYLLWFVAARFKILSLNFRDAKNEKEFCLCVRQHQKLLKYANEVRTAVCFLIFTTMSSATCALIFCGTHIFTPGTMIVKVQSAIIVGAGCGLLFVTSLSAEHAIAMSTNIGYEVYNSSWNTLSSKLLTSRIIVLQRSRKPVTVQIGGILPRLSLSYYAQYLSNVFSYLAAVRMLVNIE
ncbi:odorant receptor 30a-like isoform X2 [Belonocnema kinseyi]|uniref:odorant receptor 30a-like isoform X2 n=1 Tax=Belonocnema kinseyi TaxID=2817044 RepID=UPI00143DC06C|nr:odorant receptor 30a-like isoform X2 [Belonocnema kinseyi]